MDLKDLKEITKDMNLLYVEDDKDIANLVINYLSKLFNEVVYAENGEDGLSLYKQQNYDLVLTDIRMPKMSGLDMIFEIKQLNEHQNVVIISAYSEVENFISSIKLGVDGYIIKPINYIDMNRLLYKMANKIRIFKENENHLSEMQKLIDEISTKNIELSHYTDALNKVAIVSKTDEHGVITFVNDFFCDICGYTKDELIGQPHNIIRHPDTPKSVFENLWKTIKSGKSWEGDVKNKCKNGKPYYVHATIIPLYENDGETLREYMGIRFLTTNDEVKKRAFKKNVMLTYQEFKKDSEESKIKIDTLQSEVDNLKKELSVINLKDTIFKQTKEETQTKINKLLNQIKFLENEIKKNDEQYTKILEINNQNNKKLGDSYKHALAQIDIYKGTISNLQADNINKNAMVTKLSDQGIDQRKVISDLKDTIKNINNKKPEPDKKSILKKFL